MGKYLREYVGLYEKCFKLVHTEYMNETKRTALVKEMDQIWNKLSDQERTFMVEVVARRMYDEGLGGICGKSSAHTS